jgi:hypothetical protein
MKSDLPNASQFSPVQTPLPELLRIVRAHEPDRKAISQAILQAFFSGRGDRTTWDWKLADNTIIAMSQYGLLNKPKGDQTHASLTDLGQSLAEKASQGDDRELYDEFSRHILLNLRGLEVVACIDDLIASGQTPTKALLVKELRYRGIYHPPNGTHANGMRQWFEAAGLVRKGGWEVNKDRLHEILGVDMDTLTSYGSLTKEQRDFARAFARLNVDRALSNEVAQYATNLFGTEFPEGGLPQSVLFALQEVGLIEYEKTTTGRGAKPYVVYTTDALRNNFIEPILVALEQSAGLQYRTLIRMKYDDILANLNSESTHEKGIALEALAFFLARLLGLEFVQWRLRSNKTGGGELDVIMESARLVFSRWQIQCKNARVADLEDVAKEVGLAQVIKANVILIVTTGRIGPAARQFADQVMKETNLYVALLNGEQLKRLSANPAEIADMMNAQAEGSMTIKKGQVVL